MLLAPECNLSACSSLDAGCIDIGLGFRGKHTSRISPPGMTAYACLHRLTNFSVEFSPRFFYLRNHGKFLEAAEGKSGRGVVNDCYRLRHRGREFDADFKDRWLWKNRDWL